MMGYILISYYLDEKKGAEAPFSVGSYGVYFVELCKLK
jgi:hypothetical protein